MKRLYLTWVLFCCSAIVVACSSQDKSDPKQANKSQEETQNVSLLRLTPRDLSVPTNLIGQVEALRDVALKTEEGGPLEKVYVRKGEHVRAGRAIAEINSEVMRYQVNEAKARAELRQLELKRAELLFKEKAYTKQQWDQAKAEWNIGQSQLNYQLKRLDKAIIKAPFAGLVEHFEWEVGDHLQPGAVVARIIDLAKLKIKAGVSEGDVVYFKRGKAVTVTIDSLPNLTLQGKINYVSSLAEEASRTYQIEIVLDNPEGQIKPGMVARLRAVRKDYRDAIVIPMDAVVEQNGKKVVFVANDEQAHQRQVKLGLADGNQVVIEEGLNAEEWLVVRGQRYLTDGTRLRVTGREE